MPRHVFFVPENLKMIRASLKPHNAASTVLLLSKSSTPLHNFIIYKMDSELRLSSPRLGPSMPINESNLQLGQFDPESQPFGSFRPPTEEAESQLQNATHAFIRPPRSGEPANNFITASSSTQHQSHQGHHSNGVVSHLQPQGQSSNGLPQSQDYTNGVTHAANMSAALHAAGTGQMAPPASLSQNELAMGNNAHQARNNGLPTLQSSGQPFQSDFIELDSGSADPVSFTGPGELQGFKVVPNPPHLDYWRDRLFNVDEMITLSEEEYADSILGIVTTLSRG